MRSLALAPPVRSVTARMRRGLASVFLLHRIAQPQIGISGHCERDLRRTLEFMRKSRFNIVSLSDVVDAQNGKRDLPGDPVAFTADDGFWDQAEILAPIFLEYDVPLSIFLITDLIDGKGWPWDAKVAYIFLTSTRPSITVHAAGRPLTYSLESPEKMAWSRRHCLSLCKVVAVSERNEIIAALAASGEVELPQQPPAPFRPLSWSQARDLETRGVRFGSHTKSHEKMPDLEEATARLELRESATRLAQELRMPLSILCWPFGLARDFDDREIELARQSGYGAAFSAIEGYAVAHTMSASDRRRYQLNRFALPSDGNQLARHATGFDHVVRSLSRRPQRMRTRNASIRDSEDASSQYSLGYLRETVSVKLGQLQAALGKHKRLRQIDFKRVKRLVFTCKGNICRSPYAEARARLLGIDAISSGTDAIIGAPAEASAIRLSAVRDVSLAAHRSQPTNGVQLTRADLVIVMEPVQAERVRTICESSGAQLTLLGLWDKPASPIIPDPYGRSDGSFLRAFETIDRCVQTLKERLSDAR